MINWKVRFKNIWFWIRVVVAAAIPILTGFGLVASEMDTWGKLGQTILSILGNPYQLAILIVAAVVAVLSVIPDPTTKGVGDSTRALTYNNPAPTVPDDDTILYADHQDDLIPDEKSEDEDPDQNMLE